MKPTVGRIVHYQSYGTPGGEYASKPIAAIITTAVLRTTDPDTGGLADWPPAASDSYDVGLCIFNPTGLFFNAEVKFSEEPRPGYWSWPPRE